MTYLAVSILAGEEDSFAKQLRLAQKRGAEAIEIRADALAQLNAEAVLKMVRLVQKAKLPAKQSQ